MIADLPLELKFMILAFYKDQLRKRRYLHLKNTLTKDLEFPVNILYQDNENFVPHYIFRCKRCEWDVCYFDERCIATFFYETQYNGYHYHEYE